MSFYVRWEYAHPGSPWRHNWMRIQPADTLGIYRTQQLLRLRRVPPWDGKIWVENILIYDCGRKDI